MLIYLGPDCLQRSFTEAYNTVGTELFNRELHIAYVGSFAKIINDGILTTPHPDEHVWEKIDEYFGEFVKTLVPKLIAKPTDKNDEGVRQACLDTLKSLTDGEYDLSYGTREGYISILDMMNFPMKRAMDYTLGKLAKDNPKVRKKQFNNTVDFVRSYALAASKYDFGDSRFFSDYKGAYLNDRIQFDKSKDGKLGQFISKFERLLESAEQYEGFLNMFRKRKTLGIDNIIDLAYVGTDGNFWRFWNSTFGQVMSEPDISILQFRILAQNKELEHDLAKRFMDRSKEVGNKAFLVEIKQLVDEAYKQDKNFIELV